MVIQSMPASTIRRRYVPVSFLPCVKVDTSDAPLLGICDSLDEMSIKGCLTPQTQTHSKHLTGYLIDDFLERSNSMYLRFTLLRNSSVMV